MIMELGLVLIVLFVITFRSMQRQAAIVTGEAGTVAAPVFRDMMAYTLGHYGVPPTGSPPPTFTLTR